MSKQQQKGMKEPLVKPSDIDSESGVSIKPLEDARGRVESKGGEMSRNPSRSERHSKELTGVEEKEINRIAELMKGMKGRKLDTIAGNRRQRTVEEGGGEDDLDEEVAPEVLEYISNYGVVGKQQTFIEHLFETHNEKANPEPENNNILHNRNKRPQSVLKVDSLPAGMIILMMTYLMVILSMDNGFGIQTRKYASIKILFYVAIAVTLYLSKLLPIGSVSAILMVRWYPTSYILSLLLFGNALVNIIVSIMMLDQRYDRAIQETGQILLLFILIFPIKFEINLGFASDDLLGVFVETNGKAFIAFWDQLFLGIETTSLLHKVFVGVGFLLSMIGTVLIAFDDRREFVATVTIILCILSTICGLVFLFSRGKSFDRTAYEILALFILFVCIDLSIAHELH